MGGAADLPQRSSSPLKRRASDLDEVQSSQKDDVDMISVPPSDPPDAADVSTAAARSKRAQSIDMLKDDDEDAAADASTEQSPEAAPKNAAETGKTLPFYPAQMSFPDVIL
jgi:ubiquitin carboxyl-terminal hydrolase 4/11/15